MLITYNINRCKWCKYIYPYKEYDYKDENHGSLDVISSPHDVICESIRNKLYPKESPIFNYNLKSIIHTIGLLFSRRLIQEYCEMVWTYL